MLLNNGIGHDIWPASYVPLRIRSPLHLFGLLRSASLNSGRQLLVMARITSKDELDLFGGDNEWNADDWTSSDDRVRGGKSHSYIDCSNPKLGRFYGELDIKVLGGAGFASQRTVSEDCNWDLSNYIGIKLDIAKGDKKRYTFILKDKLPDKREDGRDESTISYEVDFNLPPESEPGDAQGRKVFVPFKTFNATYRGKLKKDAPPMDLKHIKRMSIMMRSYFGAQEGEFSLSIRSISAVSKIPEHDDGDVTTIEKMDSSWVHVRKLEEGATNVVDPMLYVIRFDNPLVKGDLKIHRRAFTVFVAVGTFMTALALTRWLLK